MIQPDPAVGDRVQVRQFYRDKIPSVAILPGTVTRTDRAAPPGAYVKHDDGMEGYWRLGELERIESGADLILAERRSHPGRGYTVAHDLLRHGTQQLAVAAWVYVGDVVDDGPDTDHYEEPPEWPWPGRWRPTPEDPIGQLVKAGGLIAAEIDRLLAVQRAAPPSGGPSDTPEATE